MNRRQKLILAILAVADVLVIGLMAVVVVTQSGRALPDLAPIPTPSPCVVYLLDSLSWTKGSARVSTVGDNLLVQVAVAQPPDASRVSPQILWTILDSLSPEFRQRCGTPERLTLMVDYPTLPVPQQYTAEISGESLVAWLQGLITDDELAAANHYRFASAGMP